MIARFNNGRIFNTQDGKKTNGAGLEATENYYYCIPPFCGSLL